MFWPYGWRRTAFFVVTRLGYGKCICIWLFRLIIIYASKVTVNRGKAIVQTKYFCIIALLRPNRQLVIVRICELKTLSAREFEDILREDTARFQHLLFRGFDII